MKVTLSPTPKNFLKVVQVNNAESSKPLKNVNAFMEWNPPPPDKKERKKNVDGRGVIEMCLLWKS